MLFLPLKAFFFTRGWTQTGVSGFASQISHSRIALSGDHWILAQTPLCRSTGADYPGRVQASPEDLSVLFPCCLNLRPRSSFSAHKPNPLRRPFFRVTEAVPALVRQRPTTHTRQSLLRSKLAAQPAAHLATLPLDQL
jgi:hypothetical protein